MNAKLLTIIEGKINVSDDGNAENCIKEAKYDMAVDYLLLKSFWLMKPCFK